MRNKATIIRKTYETNIEVYLDLDGQTKASIDTGIGFLDHMIEQIVRHAQIELHVSCKGDRHIDDHHSVEDIGIAMGQAFAKALGDKAGICRYGSSYVPLDEALARTVIDFSGRPGLYFYADFPTEKIGQFDCELVSEFFQGFVNHSMMTLHVDLIRGKNSHHIAESIFKSFAKSIKMAIAVNDKACNEIPSTKGSL